MKWWSGNDPQPLLYHNEPIWRDGRIAGHLTSGAYGHHLAAAVGLGYVTCGADEAGERFAAIASIKPLYDPKGERMRGRGRIDLVVPS